MLPPDGLQRPTAEGEGGGETAALNWADGPELKCQVLAQGVGGLSYGRGLARREAGGRRDLVRHGRVGGGGVPSIGVGGESGAAGLADAGSTSSEREVSWSPRVAAGDAMSCEMASTTWLHE